MAFRDEIYGDAAFVNTDVTTATHQFNFNYRDTKNTPPDTGICFLVFTIAGCDCEIKCYPQGWSDQPNMIGLSFKPYCQSKVISSFVFGFLDKHGRPVSKEFSQQTFKFSPLSQCGRVALIERSRLEEEFVKDGHCTIVCSVTIMSDSWKQVPKHFFNGVIPFSINEHLAELLEKEEMADVNFEVDGETFSAHRLILSARSPVFKAELFGGMVERKMKCIQIKDIKLVVFKAMLQFIYTNSVPDMSDEEIPLVALTQHLLVAADRYQLEGLKMICEERLIRDLSVDTVISMLALADEHNCCKLRTSCLDFASELVNLLQLALKTEYAQFMQSCPSQLRKDFVVHARNNVSFRNIVFKKQRTK